MVDPVTAAIAVVLCLTAGCGFVLHFSDDHLARQRARRSRPR